MDQAQKNVHDFSTYYRSASLDQEIMTYIEMVGDPLTFPS